jgi:hypothetical protein
MTPMNWKTEHHYLKDIPHEHGKGERKKEKDIQVTCGALFPEFLNLTPRALKAFIYTVWQL